MGIKKYIVGSLILIGGITGYVFSLESADYRIEVLDTVILLPIAAWIVIPTIILFVASLLHMFYYSFKAYLNKRNIVKDKEKLIELIKDNISGQQQYKTFKSDTFKEIGNILNQLNISVSNSDFESENQTINSLANKILQINAGEYVQLKEFKLDQNSELVIQNNINKTKIDENFALDILNKASSHPESLVEASFTKVLQTKSFTTIKKIIDGLELNKKMTIELLITDASYDDQFTFTSNEIINLIKKAEFTKDDYQLIARKYTNRMGPEQIIKLFEDLSSEDELATEAYLYILFEYEMLDNAREITTNSQKDEYLPYKALLDLKDNGKHYNFDNICKA